MDHGLRVLSLFTLPGSSAQASLLTFKVSHKSLSLNLTRVVTRGISPQHTQRSFPLPNRANPSVAATSAGIWRPSLLKRPRQGWRGRLLIPRPAHSQLAVGQVAAAAQERAWCGTLGRSATRITPCARRPSGLRTLLRTALPRLGKHSGTFLQHSFPRALANLCAVMATGFRASE